MSNANYFVTRKRARSNNTLDIGDCSLETLEKHLEEEYARHAGCKGFANYTCLVRKQWVPRLRRGFHLLIRGIGSRINLLNGLARQLNALPKNHTFVLYGLGPTIPLDLVVRHLEMALPAKRKSNRKMDKDREDQLSSCCQIVLSSDKHLNIIIHSFEELDQSSPKVCEFIFRLAQYCTGHVSLVVSSNHINVSQALARLSGNLNWLYYNCPTYLSTYMERNNVVTTFTRDKNDKQHMHDKLLHKDLYLQGIKDTYESLQKNAKLIMVRILEYFISDEVHVEQTTTTSTRKTRAAKRSNLSTVDDDASDEFSDGDEDDEEFEDSKNKKGRTPRRGRSSKRTMTLRQLYNECSEKFLVRTPANLYSFLQELSDHQIIRPLSLNALNGDIELAMSLDIARKFLEWHSNVVLTNDNDE